MRGSQQGQQYAGHHVALVHAVSQRKNAQPIIGRQQQRREAALPHAVRRQVHQPQRDQQNVEKAQLFPGDAQQHGVVQRCPVAPHEYIKSQILNKGYPPSVRDICQAVNLKSTSSVHAHLESLEKNGYIRRDPTKSRTIEIIDDNFNLSRREVVNIPLLGQVAAGQPLLAVENITEYFPIPSEYMPGGEVFMLKVKGDSMINMGIYEGDQIIVRKQNTASNGEVIVALVDDSATVKRFYKENGHIRLQPENDFMDPIIVDDCEILGKVIGLIRLGID